MGATVIVRLAIDIFLFISIIRNSSAQTCQTGDCTYGEWGSWSFCVCNICDDTGDYKRECIRRRSILSGPDGCDCGATFQLQCGDICCNPRCPTTNWSEWSACPSQCDVNAYQNRTRSEYPNECSQDCENLVENQLCASAGCCPVDCHLYTWSEWGECSVNCQSESGIKTRSRSYVQATCGGNECSSSDYTETSACQGPEMCDSGAGDVGNTGGIDDTEHDGHSNSLSSGCVTGTWSNWGFCPSGDSQYRTRFTMSGVCGGQCSESDGIQSREYPCQMRDFSKVTSSVIISGELQKNNPNTSVILSELGPPTNTERQDIKTYYKVAYGSELVDELQGTIPNYAGLGCLLSLLESAEYYSANVLIHSIQNHDENLISQVLIQKTNDEIDKINEAYTQLTGRTIDADLADVFQSNNERLLRALAEGGRDETGAVDELLLDSDVLTLRDSVRKNAGNPRLAQSVLATRDFEHLKHVLLKFKEVYSRRFRYFLQRNINGPVMLAFLNIAQAAEDPVLYCVIRIHDALYPSSGSVDENLLVNTIIDCVRNDMCFVRDKYFTQYGVALAEDIISNYDGGCQDVLLAVVN
ncbi:annexin A7-like [Anneissia japonica]|uniref:annexin A7-like n=1 Tax=Anneissia japonica TaxID=1529436 RepID=UPI00142567B7|nr:annexin A7-like [Anneissia japonica]